MGLIFILVFLIVAIYSAYRRKKIFNKPFCITALIYFVVGICWQIAIEDRLAPFGYITNSNIQIIHNIIASILCLSAYFIGYGFIVLCRKARATWKFHKENPDANWIKTPARRFALVVASISFLVLVLFYIAGVSFVSYQTWDSYICRMPDEKYLNEYAQEYGEFNGIPVPDGKGEFLCPKQRQLTTNYRKEIQRLRAIFPLVTHDKKLNSLPFAKRMELLMEQYSEEAEMARIIAKAEAFPNYEVLAQIEKELIHRKENNYWLRASEKDVIGRGWAAWECFPLRETSMLKSALADQFSRFNSNLPTNCPRAVIGILAILILSLLFSVGFFEIIFSPARAIGRGIQKGTICIWKRIILLASWVRDGK